MEPQRPGIAIATLKKKTKARGIRILDFKLYCKAVVIKTVWYWHKNRPRSMEQNRKPRNGPTTMWSIHLQQSRKEYPMGKSLHKWYWQNGTTTCRRMNLDHFLTPYTKMYSRWMEDLNVRQKTIKILEGKAGNNFFGLSHSDFFQDMSATVREKKQK